MLPPLLIDFIKDNPDYIHLDNDSFSMSLTPNVSHTHKILCDFFIRYAKRQEEKPFDFEFNVDISLGISLDQCTFTSVAYTDEGNVTVHFMPKTVYHKQGKITDYIFITEDEFYSFITCGKHTIKIPHELQPIPGDNEDVGYIFTNKFQISDRTDSGYFCPNCHVAISQGTRFSSLDCPYCNEGLTYLDEMYDGALFVTAQDHIKTVYDQSDFIDAYTESLGKSVKDYFDNEVKPNDIIVMKDYKNFCKCKVIDKFTTQPLHIGHQAPNYFMYNYVLQNAFTNTFTKFSLSSKEYPNLKYPQLLFRGNI